MSFTLAQALGRDLTADPIPAPYADILAQPHQVAWREYLRAHPGRQAPSRLGLRDPNTGDIMSACCLGVACHLRQVMSAPVNNEVITSGYSHELLSQEDVIFYSLRSEAGDTAVSVDSVYSLSIMNDYGVSWADIALLMELRPEWIFKLPAQ